MAYLIITMKIIVFTIFLCFTTMLLNFTIRKSQEYRYSKRMSKKIQHSLYTVCYSLVFSSMLIVSVYFPFLLAKSISNNVKIVNPFPIIRESIIDRTEKAYQQPFNSDFNVFNEINKTMERFHNEDIWE